MAQKPAFSKHHAVDVNMLDSTKVAAKAQVGRGVIKFLHIFIPNQPGFAARG